MNPLISSNLDSIRRLCTDHGVMRLDVFGSVLGEDFDDSSDVDFLVVFERSEATNAFQQYFEFKEALEQLLNRPVDLACADAIKNPVFRKEVESTRQPIYAA